MSNPPPKKRLVDYANCAGCAAKIPAGSIARVLANLPKPTDPNLLVGTETQDDAGVYRLTDDLALVQTVDFFPPVVNDPFVYGQIAAANALSDVYAMGGEPKTALNLVGYPDNQDPDLTWLGAILRGGAERCDVAGTVIVGGHTVRDAEIKYGMAVTGLIHPRQIFTNAGAKPGDKLVLTKGLGTGFVTTAARADACPEETLQAAYASMVQLNKAGRDAMIEQKANAATDVTGFGLAGHGLEMAQGSGVTLIIDLDRLPLILGAKELARRPYLTRASTSNAAYVEKHFRKEDGIDPVRLEFFFDAQTSGGLLISVPAERAESLVASARSKGAAVACIIGEVVEKRDAALIVR